MNKLPEYTTLTRAVDRLASIDGVTLDPAYTRTADAIERLYTLADTRRTDATEALQAALREGDQDSLPELLETFATVQGDDLTWPINILVGSMLPTLEDAYSRTARINYDVIANRFNTTAAQLKERAETVDLHITDAREILPLPKRKQDAWQQAVQLTAVLDELALQLTTAATAAGHDITGSDTFHERATDSTLALTVDPTESHVRRLWEAWDNTEGVFGRWGNLILGGHTITARPLEEAEPQRRPKPLEVRQFPAKQDGFNGVRQQYVDPEDADYTPAPQTGFNARLSA